MDDWRGRRLRRILRFRYTCFHFRFRWCWLDGLGRGCNRDRPSIVAEACHERLGCSHVQLGIAVIFGITGVGNDRVVESNRLASGRDDGVAFENHSQLARFGGNGWVHGAGETEEQARGLAESRRKLGWMPTSAMNRRRALSRKLTGAPRKRGNRALSDARGIKPREFSIRTGAGKSKSRPWILACDLPATNSASTAL